MIQQMIQILNNPTSQNIKKIQLPLTKDIFEILNLLEKEGYLKILKYSTLPKGQKKKNIIQIKKQLSEPSLKAKKITNIWHIKQVSKPSRKVYLNYNNITQLYKFGLGISIFKTSKGILTDKECIWNKVGGEWLFKIF